MQLHFIDSILKVDREQWNQLCPADYPFVRYEFLAALELSGSTCAATGWQPQHLVIIADGRLVAAMPGYIKTHSYGEYVFDWAWADAYRRHGFQYYPKWINAIPFTPCVGARLLCNDKNRTAEYLHQAIQTLNTHCEEQQLSGWHCLFPNAILSEQLQANQIQQRLGCQFHWFNRDYAEFDDYLGQMSSRKRKNILKERRQVSEQGFHFLHKTGAQLTPDDWTTFYQLYRNTYLKRSGHQGYLSEQFFQILGETMSDNLVMVCVENRLIPATETANGIIAAALFLRDTSAIYGRYWGCQEEYQFLHFETCYYQGIEFAIANNISRFDGGAQGEHKIARGFEPVLTYSNHWLRSPVFRPAIEQFLIQEASNIRGYADDARESLPFKKA
jgi:predicted N-acyltransferase